LKTRLGIPITLSTDPRNHFTENVGTSFRAGQLSQWPETLGFAALRSPELVKRFADVARQEYLAVGLRVALHPQIDLATEPRWARINATFGEDADLSGDLVEAYIKGFQGPRLGKKSVATMTKHFPGGGPQKDGEDPHFTYGKEQVYPGNNFEHHVKPFIKAIAAGTSQMMPYYGQPVRTEWEEVGFAFNKGIITDLLRKKLGFKGIICTDWGLITDTSILGQDMPARAWGCEPLSEADRVKKILEAGCDQFGGEARPELIIQLVEEGRVPESRIDESVRLLLREKFVLGLFDQPFVNVEEAAKTVGKGEFSQEGEDAQRRSYTLLTNQNNILPFKSIFGKRVYIEGMPPVILAKHGAVPVERPEDAEIAILRLRAPFEPRKGGFEAHFHAGSLEYSAEEKARQAAIFETVPTFVDMYLDRPAIIPEIAEKAAGLLVSYGSSAHALMDIITGAYHPHGKLPFDLPSSVKAVEESRSDVPYDTKDPLFKFGHGLSYN
jgi:beta-glucosidase